MTINNLCRCDVCGLKVEASRDRRFAIPDTWGSIKVAVCVNDTIRDPMHFDVCDQCIERVNQALASVGLTADKAQIEPELADMVALAEYVEEPS